MADSLRVDVEAGGVMSALARLGDTALKYCTPASKITADNIQQEARSRVARRTGKTADNILVSEDGAGGYFVHTSDVRLDRTPLGGHGHQQSSYYREKHVGLWLEKGTRQSDPGSHTAAPRPFFFVSAQLEEGAHERRITEAVTQAIHTEGLG